MAEKTGTEQGQEFLRLLYGDVLPATAVIEIRAWHEGHAIQQFLTSPAQFALKAPIHPLARTCFGVNLRSASNTNKYVFTPAARLDFDKVIKENVVRTLLKGAVVPPSFIVDSGGGIHAYWKYKTLLDITQDHTAVFVKRVDYGLAKVLGADPTIYDLGRVLGLPGSVNVGNGTTKIYDPPRTVVLLEKTGYVYDPQDFQKHARDLPHEGKPVTVVAVKASDVPVEPRLTEKFLTLARDGWTPDCGYVSRSEADMAVISELIRARHTPDEIATIFEDPAYKIGSKHKEKADGGKYLSLSIARAQQWVASNRQQRLLDIREFAGEMQAFRVSTKTWETVYYGTLQPIAVVESKPRGYRVSIDGEATKVFTASDFATVPKLCTALDAYGGWYGGNRDGQALLDYFKSFTDLPVVSLFHTIGFHDGKVMFPNAILENGRLVENDAYVYEGEIFSAARLRESKDWPGLAKDIADVLPTITKESVIVQIAGWMFAAFVAPQVRRIAEGTFPLLMVFGRTGAGKTQMIKRFYIMHGMEQDLNTSADVKKFTTMVALAGSNTMPFILDEYRRNEDAYGKTQLNALLREAYNAGSRKRGRPDLSVQSYHLTAPVVVVGETPFGGSGALMDRTIHVEVKPDDQQPAAWAKFNTLDLTDFNTGFYTHAYTKDLHALWRETREWLPNDLRKLSPRQADVWTAVGLGLRLMEPFWPIERTREWIKGFTVQRAETHEGMPAEGFMQEIIFALVELIKAKRLRESSEYVIRDDGNTMWIVPATVFNTIEKYGQSIRTEHPLTKEMIGREMQADMKRASPVVLAFMEVVKIAGRAVRGIKLDLERIESEYGVSSSFWRLEGMLKGGVQGE